MKKRTFLVVLLILTVLVTACSNKSINNKSDLIKTDKKLTNVSNNSREITLAATSVDFLDPLSVQSEEDKVLSSLIFDAFVNIDSKGTIQPGVSEGWKISNDGKTYTFNLQKNIKWHNGEKLTCDDVKATIIEAVQGKNQDSSKGRITKRLEYDNIKDIKVSGSNTLEISLYERDSDFLYELSRGILPEEVIQRSKNTDYNKILEPVGLGPYKVEKKTSNFVKLRKFEDYYGEKPYIDIINIKIYPDIHSVKEAFDRQEIDIMHIEPQEWDVLENIDDTALHEYPSSYFEFVALNHRKGIFKDIKVRRAINLAINKDKVLQEAVMGRGIVINTPILPTYWAYNTELSTDNYAPSKARQLLSEAGWKIKDESGILEKRVGRQNQKLQFKLLVNMSNASRYRVAMCIQKSLKDIGISVELVNVSWDELKDKVYKKDYDAAIMGWKLSENPDLGLMFSSDEIRGGNNFVSYSNPELDELLLELKTETSTSHRKKLLYKAQEIISSELPYLFLYSPNNLIAVNKNIYLEFLQMLGKIKFF